MLPALSTTTAIAKPGTFCWKERLRSPVMKTWNSAWASSSKRPFFIPSQPISWTVLISWPGKSRRNRQSRHSSSSTFISGWRQQAVPRGLDEADDLRSLDRREAGQAIVNRLAAFKVVHQILNRHPGSGENGGAAHD